MAWPPPPTIPVEPPIVPGWWVTLSYNRAVARGRADRQAREQANEQEKRLRQLRRRVERVDEAIVLAQGRDEARRYIRRQYGLPYGDLYRHGTAG